MKTFVTILIILSLIYSKGICQTIIVPDDQPTIQAAINVAVNGDTVIVKQGTYFENINFTGKDIIVASDFLISGDTSVISQTIIDADSLGAAAVFALGETNAAKLIGFTLTHGTGNDVANLKYGGAIYCSGSSPVLDHLHITGNGATGMGSGCGGGVYFIASQAILSNSIVMNNNAYYGGGIRCDQSETTIENCLIKNNSAISGGGLMYYMCFSSFVRKCIFTGNTGIYGGAMCCTESNPVIDKTTCFKNKGLYGGTINIGVNSGASIINSICWDNTMHPPAVKEIYLSGGNFTSAYNDIQGGQDSVYDETNGIIYWLAGNINIYPDFTDSASPDLHLNPASPCIDAGIALFINGTDTLTNIQDYYGNAPDMGAYEYQPDNGIHPATHVSSGNYVQIVNNNQTGENSVILHVAHDELIDLSVLDMLGRTVNVLVHKIFNQGVYYLDIPSSEFRKGAYLLRLHSTSGTITKKFENLKI
ncbi:MAG: T9SS type A sorting domain-containing protein [Bacteroidia bacterium]|nr:T9SS type A sorting domain-containing protein [Bacteroidia bacterium]